MLTKIDELFNYCPETGKLTCKVDRHRSVKAGTEIKHNARVNGKRKKAYHIIWKLMTGHWPKGVIDHIDGDRSNNAWSNLRDVSQAENTRNRSVSRSTKSGVLGVRQHTSGRWVARIVVGGKEMHIGVYDTKQEAVAARKIADAKYGFHKNHGRSKC